MVISKNYRPAPAYINLSDSIDEGAPFYDKVVPADFPQGKLRFRNNEWASHIGLDTVSDAKWMRFFRDFEPLPDNFPTPIAVRYHGHQFRHYNPDIGDGRGFLYAQLRDDQDRLLDLGTKGSGQTPYSRSGDGRLTLKGGVREVLATQMLEALGVYTSKSFSLIETGESLHRNDEPSPARSAVLVRLSHSHVRFGVFQRLAFEKNAQAIERLVDYCIDNFYPRLSGTTGDDRVLGLYQEIITQSARLVGQWMAAGFVHGVLNTDNLNVTGESFDYGPWRFVPTADPGFTAAYFDQTGLYSYGRQGEAVGWNLSQLGGALSLLVSPDALTKCLQTYPRHYEKSMADAFFARLGLACDDENTASHAGLVMDLLKVMALKGAPFEQTFFDLYGGKLSERRINSSKYNELYQGAEFATVIGRLYALTPAKNASKTLEHPYFAGSSPCTMLIDEVENIWSHIADDDDWAPFQAKLAQIGHLQEAYGHQASHWA